MQELNHFKQARLGGATIEVMSMARGEVKLITIYQPSKETTEVLDRFRPGDTIECIELNQRTSRKNHGVQMIGHFECLSILEDRMHGRRQRHLLVRELVVSHEDHYVTEVAP